MVVDVDEQHVGHEHRQGEEPHGAGHEHGPAEHRDTIEAHARCAQRDHRGDDADRGEQQRQDEADDGEESEVDGSVAGSADAAVDAVGHDEQAARQDPGPEGEGGGAGEGDGAGADLERNDHGGQTEEQRHGHEQHESERRSIDERVGGRAGEEIDLDQVQISQQERHCGGRSEQQRQDHVHEADGPVITGSEEGARDGRGRVRRLIGGSGGLWSRVGYRHVSWDLIRADALGPAQAEPDHGSDGPRGTSVRLSTLHIGGGPIENPRPSRITVRTSRAGRAPWPRRAA